MGKCMLGGVFASVYAADSEILWGLVWGCILCNGVGLLVKANGRVECSGLAIQYTTSTHTINGLSIDDNAPCHQTWLI